MLIGGDNGIFYDGTYGKDGELTLGERIEIEDADGDQRRLVSLPLPIMAMY